MYGNGRCREDAGLHPSLKLVWALCHGLASVKLSQHFLRTFSSCASIGETFLVTSGIVLYFGDMLLLTIKKLHGLLMSSELVTAEYEISRSEISIIIQLPLKQKDNKIGRSLMFVASLGIVLILIVPSWMQFVHEF
ncbi:hypothetical protein JHK87_052474 [Glycine soja]|nr:hypothetical protein JHK87_052474 [Glycine soja]